MDKQPRQTLIEISTLFYQDRAQEGMAAFMQNVTLLAGMSDKQSQVAALFDALDRQDFLCAADILCYELAGLSFGERKL